MDDKKGNSLKKEEIDYNLLKNLFLANPDTNLQYQSRFTTILQNVRMMMTNKTQRDIIEQLDQADLVKDVTVISDDTAMLCNGLFFLTLLSTQFFFKKWHWKLLYFTSFAYVRLYMFEPILMEYRLRSTAKQNTLLGQEIRNLYRFYNPDDEITKQMKEQCQKYLETQQLRKENYRKRL